MGARSTGGESSAAAAVVIFVPGVLIVLTHRCLAHEPALVAIDPGRKPGSPLCGDVVAQHLVEELGVVGVAIDRVSQERVCDHVGDSEVAKEIIAASKQAFEDIVE